MFLTVLAIIQVLNKWHEAPRRYRLDGCERPHLLSWLQTRPPHLGLLKVATSSV